MNETVRGVVIWDRDADRLVELPALQVEHEGRTRLLTLRVARGTIQDVRPATEKAA